MDVPSASPPVVRTVEIRPPSARAETANVLRVAALIVLATWIYLADTAAPGRAARGAAAAPGAAQGPAAGAAAPAVGGADARDLMPYQRLFRTLAGPDQRQFRELQEGLVEAENLRSSTGSWPAPAVLAAQGIPPFADTAPGGGRAGRRAYHWELRRENLVVNYLGVPADRRDPSFLLLVQEPDPRSPAAAAAVASKAAMAAPPVGAARAAAGAPAFAGFEAGQATDEVHHRLADGTLLHVSTWMRAGGPAGAAGAPAREAGVIAEPFARGWVQLLAGTARR